MTSGGSRAARRAEQRPPGSSSSHCLCSPSGSTRRHGAHGRRTAVPGPPPPRPPPWRRWGSAGPCPVPKRCWDSRGICGWKLPNFLGRMVSVHASRFPTPPASPPPLLWPRSPPPSPSCDRPLGGQRCYLLLGCGTLAEVPTPTLCLRERASHSWPLTCLSPPPVCVYLLGTELDESFKEFGKNREVMGLCREGESSPPDGVCTQPWGSFLVASAHLPCLPH